MTTHPPQTATATQQTTAILNALKVFHEIIKEATETTSFGGIPNGHLYSMVMDKMPLEVYTQLIGMLKDAGLVAETNHLLYSLK